MSLATVNVAATVKEPLYRASSHRPVSWQDTSMAIGPQGQLPTTRSASSARVAPTGETPVPPPEGSGSGGGKHPGSMARLNQPAVRC